MQFIISNKPKSEWVNDLIFVAKSFYWQDEKVSRLYPEIRYKDPVARFNFIYADRVDLYRDHIDVGVISRDKYTFLNELDLKYGLSGTASNSAANYWLSIQATLDSDYCFCNEVTILVFEKDPDKVNLYDQMERCLWNS